MGLLVYVQEGKRYEVKESKCEAWATAGPVPPREKSNGRYTLSTLKLGL